MTRCFVLAIFFSFNTSILFSQTFQGKYGCQSKVGNFLPRSPYFLSPNPSNTWPSEKDEYFAFTDASLSDTLFQLPIVFHIIHDGESIGDHSNLDPELISSQLAILNEDFRVNELTILDEEDQLIADIGIQFKLASHRPDGCPLEEVGINRIDRNIAGFLAPPYTSSYLDSTIKPLTIWNPDRYINIWVCPLISNIAGYAQFPNQSGLSGIPSINGPEHTDGVVLDFRRVGENILAEGPFNLGRTATHELGHFLGLIHIWGDGGCGVDDFCEDTPEAELPYEGCPDIGFSCDSDDMIGNYMDFVDDACMSIFTVDQWARMVKSLLNSPRRKNLNAKTLSPTPIANFSSSIIKSCDSPKVLISHDVNCFPPSQVRWTFPQANIVEQSKNSFTLLYPSSGIYEISLRVENEFGSDSIQKVIDISEPQPMDTLLKDNFEGDLGQWDILNPDEAETWSLGLTRLGDLSPLQKSAFIPLYDYTARGERDALISPALDFTQYDSLMLCFSYAYRPLDDLRRDSLIIRASIDNGNTFPITIFPRGSEDLTQFYSLAPSNLFFIPQEEGDWCGGLANFQPAKCISLQEFQGANHFRMKVEVYNDFGNNIYLDNIRIIGSCKKSLPTDHDDNLLSSVDLYPNPADLSTRIYLNHIEPGPVILRILSPSGKLLRSRNWHIYSTSHIIPIDLQSLPKGLLFVQLFVNRKVAFFKLLHL